VLRLGGNFSFEVFEIELRQVFAHISLNIVIAAGTIEIDIAQLSNRIFYELGCATPRLFRVKAFCFKPCKDGDAISISIDALLKRQSRQQA